MRVTVVTPSLDQGAYIERTVESVLSQRGQFELEYLVMDGGSTDGTLDILRRYEGRLGFRSGPDGGQSAAINAGLRRATGEVVAWLNSDDVYLPGAVEAAVAALRGGARWCFGECRIIDERDREIRRPISRYKAWVGRRYSRRRLVGRNFVPQPAVFFRRDLFEEAGPLDAALRYAMDYDLWLRFAALAEPAFVPRPLAAFRWHGRSITASGYAAAARECLKVAARHARGAGEHVALAEHLAHALAEVVAYRALDLGRHGAIPTLRR